MKITFKKLLDRIETWCDNHLEVGSFKHGEFPDHDTLKNEAWPMVYIVPQPATHHNWGVEFSFDFVIMGTTQQKGDSDAELHDDIKQVQSTASQIIRDFIAEINGNGSYFDFQGTSLTILLPVSAVPFEEDYGQVLTGWNASIVLQASDVLAICEIPYDGAAPSPSTDCAVATIKATEGDDDIITIDTVASGGTYTFAKIDVLQQDDSVIGSGRIAKDIKLTNADLTGVVETATEIELTADVASPSGHCYMNIVPRQYESHWPGDVGTFVQADRYDVGAPAYAETVAKIDVNATEEDVRPGGPYYGPSGDGTDSVYPTMMEDENIYGNFHRFTDSKGNPCDAAGSSIWNHTDWPNHDFTGAGSHDGIVYDHAYRRAIDINYQQDGTKYCLNSTNTTGQAWENWLSFFQALGTYAGLTNWRAVSMEEAAVLPHGARMSREPWALNFFVFEGSGSRGGMITGNTVDDDDTDFWSLYDTGNVIYSQEWLKAGSSSFGSREMNCFIVTIF